MTGNQSSDFQAPTPEELSRWSAYDSDDWRLLTQMNFLVADLRAAAVVLLHKGKPATAAFLVSASAEVGEAMLAEGRAALEAYEREQITFRDEFLESVRKAHDYVRDHQG